MADLNGILQSLFDSTNNALRVSSASAGITYATPAFTLSTSNAAGAATTLVRSDAQLALFDATVPVTQAMNDAAATGSAAFAARRDHKHGMPIAQTTHGCRVYNNGTQSINNNTSTPILFTSEDDDTDAYHSTSSNTSRITIPAGLAGVYAITAAFPWAANATGNRWLIFQKNGASINGTQIIQPGNSALGPQMGGTVYLRLAVGDYVEVNAFQNSGGALLVGSASQPDYASFSAYLIGA